MITFINNTFVDEWIHYLIYKVSENHSALSQAPKAQALEIATFVQQVIQTPPICNLHTSNKNSSHLGKWRSDWMFSFIKNLNE